MPQGIPRTPDAGPVGPGHPGAPISGWGTAGAAPVPPPTVTVVGVTNLDGESVTLVGAINTFGYSGSWWFVWGTTPQTTNVFPPTAVLDPSKPESVQFDLTGLTNNTTYYFALVGQSPGGTVTSTPLSFTTNKAIVTTVGNVANSSSPSSLTTPHFVFPFTIVSGTPRVQYGTQITSRDGALVAEQDSDADVFSCVGAIMSCTVGQWPEVPSFGIPDLAFSQMPPNLLGLSSTVSRWEPRANTGMVAGLLDDDVPTGDWVINTNVQVNT